MLNTYLDASIGRRLALGMTTMLLVVLGASTVFLVRAERQEMEDILQEKGKTAVNMISPRIAGVIGSGAATAIAGEVAPVLADRDFDYVYVFDDKRVLANASDPGIEAGSHLPLPALERLRVGHSVIREAGNYMEVLSPITGDGRTVAALGLGVSLDLIARQVHRMRLRLLAITAGLMASALAFVHWWTRKTVGPLIDLTRSAERLSEGDLSVRVAVTGAGEVSTLAATFNHLATSLEHTLHEKDRALNESNRLYRNLKIARAQLGQAERLSAVGMLAAGVSHELNNPLGIILSTAGNVREALDGDSPLAEDVSIIEAEAQRCRRIIQGLLNFAATGESHPQAVEISALLQETFALARRDDRARGLTADWALDAQLPALWVDPRQLQQVFLNLFLNAADAMEGRGTVSVHTGESIEGGRRQALIEFRDHGCGIDPADRDHIFDPFYTTKKGGAGYGLGLAVSYGIIAAHGGEITVRSESRRGSVFTIRLPLSRDSSETGAASKWT